MKNDIAIYLKVDLYLKIYQYLIDFKFFHNLIVQVLKNNKFELQIFIKIK